MKVWGLYSTRVDYGCSSELLAVFVSQAAAEAVRDGLIGMQRYPGMRLLVWEDDEDYPDLYVGPLDVLP